MVPPGGTAPSEAAPVEPASGGVRLVEERRVAALVSNMHGRPRMTAQNLDRHQRVAEGAMAQGWVVLPFRFGVVVDSPALVHEFLDVNHSRLLAALERYEGLVETLLTARYVGDAALRDVLRLNGRARRLQQRIRKMDDAAAYFDRISLGEEVAAGLARLQRGDAASFRARLRPGARAEALLPNRDESIALRAAYLLTSDETERFDDALASLALEQEGRVAFELVGPVPPWHFVELGGGEAAPSPRRSHPHRSRLHATEPA